MKRPAALLAGMVGLTGCGSFTHFQTAQSLPAGMMSFDVQGGVIALNEGAHYAARMRAGLGKGFEAGVESDVISVLFYNFLMSPGGFGLIMGDLKWQALEQSEAVPFSWALGFGGGSGFLTDFYFVQTTVSRTVGPFEPYLAWRYQRIHLDVDLDDEDEREDLEDSYLKDVFAEAGDTRFGLHHIFVGMKIMISETIFIMPEASLIFGDADGVGSVGVAVGFQK